MKLRKIFFHPVQTTLCYVFVLHRKQLVINLMQYSRESYNQEIKSSTMLSLKDVFTRHRISHGKSNP